MGSRRAQVSCVGAMGRLNHSEVEEVFESWSGTAKSATSALVKQVCISVPERVCWERLIRLGCRMWKS